MDKTKWGKNKKIIVFSLFAVLIAAVLFYILRPQAPQRELVGGEVYPPDLDNGYTIYIEAAHDYHGSTYTGLMEEQHYLKEVTEIKTAEAIKDLCLQMEQCRKFMRADSSSTGSSEGDYDFLSPQYRYVSSTMGDIFRSSQGDTNTQIYLLAGDYCYKIMPIEIEWMMMYEINIELADQCNNDETIESCKFNYLDDMTLPIDEPLFRFCRIDMTERPEDMTELDYILSVYDYQDMFTDSTQQEYGWISTMPQESFDELMEIVESFDDSNSTVAVMVENGRIAG